jgi:hypothetical protein
MLLVVYVGNSKLRELACPPRALSISSFAKVSQIVENLKLGGGGHAVFRFRMERGLKRKLSVSRSEILISLPVPKLPAFCGRFPCTSTTLKTHDKVKANHSPEYSMTFDRGGMDSLLRR